MKNPYVDHEKEIMDALVKAVNCFRKLTETHPCHQKDFVDGIHKCQDVIIHRIVQRDYPNEFPVYLEKEK